MSSHSAESGSDVEGEGLGYNGRIETESRGQGDQSTIDQDDDKPSIIDILEEERDRPSTPSMNGSNGTTLRNYMGVIRTRQTSETISDDGNPRFDAESPAESLGSVPDDTPSIQASSLGITSIAIY
jgi:hypothetical protein